MEQWQGKFGERQRERGREGGKIRKKKVNSFLNQPTCKTKRTMAPSLYDEHTFAHGPTCVRNSRGADAAVVTSASTPPIVDVSVVGGGTG
jgi:hypothetical protein